MRAIWWGQIIVAMLFCLSCSEKEIVSADDLSMPEQFVVVNDEIPSLVFNIRYYSDDNFFGDKSGGV